MIAPSEAAIKLSVGSQHSNAIGAGLQTGRSPAQQHTFSA